MTTTRAILIDGDATTPQPPTDPREPRAVVGRTLSKKPVVQGYEAVTLTYPIIAEADLAILESHYDPADPAVTIQIFDGLSAADHTYSAMMEPIRKGSHGPGFWRDVSVRFSGLVAAS